MMWSIHLRYWAYKATPDNRSNTDRIRLFVMYHQGIKNTPLEHSLGLQKGLIGIIHGYAKSEQNQQNAIVLAHEILHTVGATDKYDHTNQPIYPDGYAVPDQMPIHPQAYTEIMAGTKPLSEYQSVMPAALTEVIIGRTTATEISWLVAP